MRPYDGSPEWWRDEMIQVTQIAHQGHTGEGTWRECPMASCTRVRHVLAEAFPPKTAEDESEWAKNERAVEERIIKAHIDEEKRVYKITRDRRHENTEALY